jgi:hypothetical protein
MGIKTDCESYYSPSSVEATDCIAQTHKHAIEWYQGAIGSKFESGENFTISDVWQYAVSIYELPANGIQLALANVVWLHDFFELDRKDFLDPNPVLSFLSAMIAIYIIGAILTAWTNS